MALLAQFLVAFGTACGRGAHYTIEADHHYPNEFCVLVGPSGKGRKGSSWGHVRRALAEADPDFVQGCLASGLSSGEGLIAQVRDAVDDGDADAPVDKRRLVLEQEFAQVLKVLRVAWRVHQSHRHPGPQGDRPRVRAGTRASGVAARGGQGVHRARTEHGQGRPPRDAVGGLRRGRQGAAHLGAHPDDGAGAPRGPRDAAGGRVVSRPRRAARHRATASATWRARTAAHAEPRDIVRPPAPRGGLGRHSTNVGHVLNRLHSSPPGRARAPSSPSASRALDSGASGLSVAPKVAPGAPSRAHPQRWQAVRRARPLHDR
jgi:hypothetical protein